MKNTQISQVNVEAGQSASLPTRHSPNPSARRATRGLFVTAILSILLIPAAQLQSKAQAIEPEYIPLNAGQLDQLVAPIALDPDPLVAQILIAATFPDQVGDANNWLSTKMSLSPDQRAAGASNMSWDPSIKGLIVFPVVLDSMAKNTSWTTQLGNAYYNQPDDVMDAIQAMRSDAYQSHALVATTQQNVVVTGELVEILPVNPDVVFVQYYNPWTVFGTEVVAYPGYVVEPAPAGVVVAEGVSFEPAVSVSLDAHFGFSFGGWAPGWGGGAVVYNHNVYNSNSRTVANHGHFGDHDGRRFDHRGHDVRAGYRRGDRPGMGRRGPGSRPMSQRISNNRSNSPGRPTSTNHSSGSRTGARSTSNVRTTSTGHSNSAGHSVSSNHSNTANRPATRNISNARSTSTGRSTSGNRGMSQPASSRTISQSRSTGSSPSMSRPASSNSSFGGNRPASRPASATSSIGANRPSSSPAAANRSTGASQSMSHPASTSHSGGGAGFGGAHMGGGKKK
jgi:Protein of unknown function (DUF3300)